MSDIRAQLDNLEVFNFENRVFIPFSEVQNLFTKDKIISLLQQSSVESYDYEEILRTILNGGLRTFAVLALIQEIGSSKRFLDKDHFGQAQWDSKLPTNDSYLVGIFNCNKTREKFLRKQWTFLAPFFQADQSHRTLDKRTVLPFTKDAPLGAGGFGRVLKVTVERSHHRISESGGDLDLACKQIFKEKEHSSVEQDYQNEAHILSLLRCLQHPSIIRLIAAFTIDNTYNFLFPLAEGNLKEFFELQSRPIGLQDDEEIFNALWSLSSAIEAMHNYFSSEFGVRKIGCHFDIKPRNILHHRGRFLLTDFGLSRIRDENDGSKTTFKRGEGFYLAPECEDAEKEFEKGMQGRKSDIWSFGCILSEMLAYLQGGSTAVTEYFKQRRQKLGPQWGHFFHHGHQSNPGVEKLLEDISRQENKTLPQRLVDLVRSMLQIDPEYRPDSSKVTSSLFHVAQEAIVDDIRLLLLPMKQDIELDVELERLVIVSEALGLKSASWLPYDQTWLAMSHKHEMYEQVRTHLRRYRVELQAILQRTRDNKEPGFRQNYHLQRIQDQLWDLQPTNLRSTMMHRLEKTMLDKGNSVLSATPRVHSENPKVIDYDDGTNSTHRQRLRLFSIMRSISDAMAHEQVSDQELIIDPSRLIRPFNDLHFHYLSTIGETGQRVLIERMRYSSSWHSRIDELLERVKSIASLRNSAFKGQIGEMQALFPILECQGYYHEPTKQEFGIVYQIPDFANGTDPMSLWNLITVTKERSNQPSVSKRFDLASKLVTYILDFHTAGWLHKNICSFNIICFPQIFETAAASIARPYIVGFNYSRMNAETAFTEGPGQEDELKEYQHPTYLRNLNRYSEEPENPGKRFRQEFEYYSVGLVLLEIGLWRPLSKITEGVRGSPEQLRKYILKHYVPLLQSYMGDPYCEAVRECLCAYSDDLTSPEEAGNAFNLKVVRPIVERMI